MTDYSKYDIVLVVSGCRDYENYEEVWKWIFYFIDFLVVMSGGIVSKERFLVIAGECESGVGQLVKIFCTENNYAYEGFPADWKQYGNSAGPIRNRTMAKVGTHCLAFRCKKSKGTKDMIEAAGERLLPTLIIWH